MKRRSPSGRPSSAEAQKRVERLLEIACQVFLESGYEMSSMDEIARRAGASKQTFYSRYPTKAALFTAVIEKRMGRMQDRFSKVFVAHRNVGQVLESFGRNLLDAMVVEDFRLLYRVVIVAAESFPELSESFWEFGPRRAQLTLAEYLSRNLKMRKVEAEHAAEIFCATCLGYLTSKLSLFLVSTISPRERQRRVREAVRVFLSAYGGVPDIS